MKVTLGWRRLTSAGAVAALTACGGGGGGGGGTAADGAGVPTSPAPVPTALAITADNMARVASLSTGWAENVLWFGEMAIDFAGRFRNSAADQRQSCPNGGVLALRLVDRDGNGRLSAGDAVVADLRDCTVPIVGTVLVGTLTVEVASSVDSPRSMRGTVLLGPTGVNAVFGSGPSAEYLGLKGSVAFEGSTSDAATTLTVKSTAADDFSLSGPDGTRSVTERVRQFDIARTLQYDEARSKTRIQLRYDSELLGGTVTVTTPQPLQAYLDTYPEQGQVVVRGSGGRALYLTPNFVTNSPYVSVGLDSNSDERVDTSMLVPWNDVSVGYLWWNGRGTAPATYSTQSYSANAFSYTAVWYGQTVGVNDPIIWQFSRPPANPPALRFRLRDQGDIEGRDPQRLDIDADTAFQGALLVVRPRTQLRHGRNYVVEASTDGGASWPSAGLPLRDALGNTLTFYSNVMLTTAATMRASIVANTALLSSANAVVRLDGSGSSSERPIASYRWRQLGGTPLAIAAPNAAVTELRWGPTPPTGLERITLELTVTDVNGEQDTSRVVVSVISATGSGPLLYFRSSAGDYIGGGETFIGDSSTGSFSTMPANSGYVSLSYTGAGFLEWWTLTMATADDSPLRVGAYDNAVRAPFHGNAHGIELSGSGRGCNSIVGRYDVLEIATDTAGIITRLAVDFEQRCESATAPPLYGSFRFNSSIPLRP